MSQKYDTILTLAGTAYNYMLRQAGNTKDWLVTDAPLLPRTLITESASPTSISPEREIQISQVDWRKGFQDFLLDDVRKYFDAINCDARFKGEVILSPKKLSSLAYSGAATPLYLDDWGFEDWASADALTHWTETGNGTYDLEREGTIKRTGTYAARLQHGNGDDITLSQSIVWSNVLRGVEITSKIWAKSTDAHCSLRIGIHDGVDDTWCTPETGIFDWKQLTVSKTLGGAATQCKTNIEADGTGEVTYIYVDDFSIEGVSSGIGSCAKVVQFGSEIVSASGSILCKLSGSNFVKIVDFGYPITDLCVFVDTLYIALGWYAAYWYTSNLSAFTLSTLSENTAKYMANVGNSQFWISETANTMRDSADPTNGADGHAFSTAYTIGSSDYEITGLVDHDSIVFVRKEDDVYYLSEGDVLSLLNLKTEASTSYVYDLYLWGDRLYIPSGVNSLYEYDIASGVATVISPVRYASGDANYDGQVIAFCHDESYLYICIDNGSTVKILAGRWENVDGDTDWWWHPLYDKRSEDITTMLISSASGSKRLYAGTDTYTDGIYCFIVPVSYTAIYLEAGFKCEASGTFITPWETSNFPTEQKLWKSKDFTSKCITGKTSIIPYYQVKGGEWVAMTVLTASALDDGDYPVETTDSRTIEVSSERIRFKLHLATEDDDYTPILYGTGGGLVTYAVLQTDKERQIIATIQLAPKIRLRDDTVEERTISTDLANLRTLYQGGEIIVCTGPDGTEYDVVFTRDGYKEQLAYDPTGRIENWWCSLKLLEV